MFIVVFLLNHCKTRKLPKMGNCWTALFRLLDGTSQPPDTTPILVENDADYQQPANGLPPPEDNSPLYFLSPGVGRHVTSLTEEEQFVIARRLDLIEQMSSSVVSGRDKITECVICMTDIDTGETVRYLPCTHTFHQHCIDTWLMRNLSCPICMTDIEEDM